MSQSSDIPRPPHTDTARRLLASHRPTGEIVHTAEPDVAIPEPRAIPEIAPRPAAAVRPATTATQQRIRTSDTEREDTVHVLHRALGEGRLDLHETEKRVTAAYAAVYRDELPPLLGDLPQHHEIVQAFADGSGAPSWQALWTAVVWRARTSFWDEVGSASRSRPPGRQQRRLAVLLLAFAGLWVMICAVLGAVL